ncbi:FAD/NAD(P)-binding domain-containing protein, partial [Hymenopellis radicata]
MDPNTKFKVIICGGGIGGLVCAVQLGRYPNIELEVYESADKFSPVGAGIGVWPRTWGILEMMGLTEDLAKVASNPVTDDEVVAWSLRKSDQLDGFEFGQVRSKGHLQTFHRGDIHDVFVKHLSPNCKIFYSKRIQSYTESSDGTVALSFADGSTATCDVLIGADGLKSSVRASMFERMAHDALNEGRTDDAMKYMDSVSHIWTGSIVYRALVPTDKLKEKGFPVDSEPTQHCGRGLHIVTYPVINGTLLNVGIFRPQRELMGTQSTLSSPVPADVSEVRTLTDFSKWEPRVQALLDCMDITSKWPVFCINLLSTYASGHTALIGDAAHAMFPHQASGAGQAIEDAHLLACLLGHERTSKHNLADVLRIYSDMRLPFASEIWDRSEQNSSNFALVDPDADTKLKSIAETVHNRWAWAWDDRYNHLMEVS